MHGYAPKEYFDLEKAADAVTGFRPNVYILKSDKSATDALKAMTKGLSFVTTQMVCDIARMLALSDTLGREKFDHLFAATSPAPLRLTAAGDPLNPLLLLINSRTLSFPQHIKRGDSVLVQGMSDMSVQDVEIPSPYVQKHYNGQAGACNAICADDSPSGEMQFVAAGLNGKAPLSEVQQLLLREFNRTPLTNEEISTEEVAKKINSAKQSLHNRELLKQHEVTLERFLKQGGGQISNTVTSFDVARIAQLAINNPIKGRALLNEWKAQLLNGVEVLDV